MMSGTYIIGPEGDYTILSDALSDIMEKRVDGEIIFEVQPGTYNESLYIPPILTHFSHLSTHGFTIQFTDFNTRGVVLDGSNHQFRGMIFIGSGISDGRHSNRLHIENCTFQGASIILLGANRTPSLGNVHIIGNTFRSGHISMNRLRGDYTISDNVIYARRTGIQIQNAPVNGKIFNNYVLVEHELHGREGLFLHTVDSVLVYHNTLKNLRGHPFKVSGEAYIHLKNNIIFAITGYTVDLEFHGSVTSDYNGYYTSREGIARIGEFQEWEVYDTFADFTSATGQDANSMFRDPRFDFEAGDSLQRMMPETSAFQAAGADLSEEVPEDLLGNPRPAAPSLGAFEYVGTETSAPGSDHYGIAALPVGFALTGNYPNPFNPSTTISHELHEPADILLSVYDVYGRLIATLVNEKQAAGSHTSVFNATGIASGLYIYRLSSDSHSLTGKMVLVK